jgi:hypothetical protein
VAYQELAKTKLTWEDKVKRFAEKFGPFTTKWDDYRAFHLCEGFYEVRWPKGNEARPPLIELDEKPSCACCGSRRPLFMRYLTDRNGGRHLVGQECYSALCDMKLVKHLDFASPIPETIQETVLHHRED